MTDAEKLRIYKDHFKAINDALCEVGEYPELGCGTPIEEVVAAMARALGKKRLRAIVGRVRAANTRKFNVWKRAGYPAAEGA